MSSAAWANPAVRAVAYGAVALAIAFEIAVVWLVFHPDVPADYRAYYIDKSTTCLNQPVSGAYAFGTTISFRSDGRERAMPLRVCGWEGPAGDGTHAVGTSSRLRFILPPGHTGPLLLRLELVAVTREGHPQQRVEITTNGKPLGQVTVYPQTPQWFALEIPAAQLQPGPVEVGLQYPDAIRMGPNDSDTRWRSIKLLSASLGTAPAT